MRVVRPVWSAAACFSVQWAAVSAPDRSGVPLPRLFLFTGSTPFSVIFLPGVNRRRTAGGAAAVAGLPSPLPPVENFGGGKYCRAAGVRFLENVKDCLALSPCSRSPPDRVQCSSQILFIIKKSLLRQLSCRCVSNKKRQCLFGSASVGRPVPAVRR